MSDQPLSPEPRAHRPIRLPCSQWYHHHGRVPRKAALFARGAAALALAVGFALASAAGGAARDDTPRRAQATPELAAVTQQLEVFTGHPRLIVGGYRGLSIEALRQACAHPDARGECSNIATGILSDAMLYLLNGDRDAAGRAKLWLLTGVRCGEDAEHSEAGGSAIAYDWIADTMNPAEKARIERGLAACGVRIASELRSDAPHLWHGFTSRASALALIALAVDDPPEKAALLADAQELFRGRALEAYAVVGGAWPEGYNYLRSHFFSSDTPSQYVLDAIRAWDSAVARDHPEHESLIDTIAHEEGDWLSGLAYHVLYGTVEPYGEDGKPTLLRGGDMPTVQAHPNKQIRPFMDAIALVTADPILKGWGTRLEDYWSFVGGDGTYHTMHRYALPLDLPTQLPAAGPENLPLSRVWAPADLGYVLARSSWAPDATLLGYRAGKWFTGHQHMDQGHIDLWRNGPLAVDSGVYANWGTEHREHYYSRTVAHNTLLIHREGETFDQHPSAPDPVNDGGQRVHTYRGCPQCMQSVEEWRTNIHGGLHLEAGVLEGYHDDDAIMAVSSDLTSAYNSTAYSSPGNVAKVERVQRDLVFRRPDLIMVTDRVRITEGTEPPTFVLHLPERPSEPEGEVILGTRDDGILEAAATRFVMDNGTGGRLVTRTLLPADGSGRTRLIGGPNHRYWVDGANRRLGTVGHEGAPAEPGSWRVEVTPSGGPRNHLLVHALTVTDTGTDEIPTLLLPAVIDPAGGDVVAIGAGTPVDTVFVTSAAVPRAPLAYATIDVPGASPGGLLVVLSGLQDGAQLRIGSGDAVMEAVAVGGAWSGRIPASGSLTVASCPPPSGASEEWANLCSPAPNYLPLVRQR